MIKDDEKKTRKDYVSPEVVDYGKIVISTEGG